MNTWNEILKLTIVRNSCLKGNRELLGRQTDKGGVTQIQCEEMVKSPKWYEVHSKAILILHDKCASKSRLRRESGASRVLCKQQRFQVYLFYLELLSCPS